MQNLHKKVRIKLHRGQALVHASKARFRVVVAGRRWGKTAFARSELIEEASLASRRKVWYVAPSYRMAKQIMWDELKQAIPRRWIKKINETELSIRLVNGSIIECKGADDPDSLRGVGLHALVLDEFQDMKDGTWATVLRPTLAKDRGRALFIGTPKGYANLYDVYKLGLDPKNRAWASWQFPTRTSPFIPLQEIEEAKRDMDPKTFRQEFEASFETMSGRVYYAFERKTHVGRYPFNPKLPIWVGQDFNLDPMSSVIMQPQPNGEVWVVDEVYRFDSHTLDVCEELERRYWRYIGAKVNGNSQITIFPDPNGGTRQHARGESDLDIFREKGFRSIRHRRRTPAVADRVNAVNRLLMDARGAARLRVNESCINTIASLEQTLYREGTRDIDKRGGVEHATDALGYPIELNFPSKKIQIAGYSF